MASAVTGGERPVPSVLIMGATCVDRVLSVAAYPRPDSKMRTTSNAEMCGGNAANVAAALALLSAPTFTYARHAESTEPAAALCVVLLTKVGDDNAAVHLKADLES